MLIATLVIAGAFGAVSRYVVDDLVKSRFPGPFPWGTLVINVTGSFILGVVTGLALYHGLGAIPKTAIGVGFCGAYTTFSTFSYETVHLIETGDIGPAAGYALGSVAVGLIAAGAAIALTAAL
jgi:fluoride exporter